MNYNYQLIKFQQSFIRKDIIITQLNKARFLSMPYSEINLITHRHSMPHRHKHFNPESCLKNKSEDHKMKDL